MYLDEYGNDWASYEDYQKYINSRENEIDIQIIHEFVNDTNSFYIDSNGVVWDKEEKESD